MTRPLQDPQSPREQRTRIALAALTGLLAGATRTVADWLLNHFSG